MKTVFACFVSFVAGCSGAPASPSNVDADQVASGSDALDVASSTCRSKPGETSVHVVLKVDEYRGIHHGHNGDHEVVETTVASTLSVANPSVVDTSNVEIAMNVKSSTDPSGLPQEVPMAVGDTFEVQGEYIPAATANAHNANGAAAVIHFTHAPCGFVKIAGEEYR
jgi:hypothetical protein